MKNYIVVMDGFNGYHKEEVQQFEGDNPPDRLIVKTYEEIVPYRGLCSFLTEPSSSKTKNAANLVFQKRDEFTYGSRTYVHYNQYA